MPHYEPPPERFTPPREVTYTPVPSVSKSSKRKSTPKAKSAGKVRRLTLQIKKEPPDIDLNAPLPPPSPTDDPLLLTGPSYSRRRSKARISHVTHSRETPPIASSSPVHPSADDTKLVDMNFNSLDFDTDDDNDHIGPIPPIFNFQFHEGDEEPWSDDEPNHNDFEHSGEYTGKFKILTVPTKADPPSSCTRGRMDAWGHPISPFPYSARRSPIPESPVREAELDITDSHNEDDLFAESRRAVNGYINGTSYLLPSRSETSDGQLDGLHASPTPERKSEIPPPPLELPTQEDEMDAQPPEDMSADTVLEYDAPLAGDEEMLDFSSGSPVFHAPENCPEELAEVTDYASTVLGEIVDDGAGSNEAVPITDEGEEEHRAVLENSQPTQPYFDSSFSTTRTGGSQHADASHANYPVGRDMVLGQEESAQDVSLECGHSSVLQESIPDSTGMLSFTSGEAERISQRSLELEKYQQDTQTEAHQELLHSPDQDIDDGHQDREEEEEDTASVVRELSHEPDFRSDDDDDDDKEEEEEEEEEEDGQGFNFNHLPSSPNNPFRPDLPLSPPALSTQVVPPHYSEEHESARQASYVNILSDDDDEDLDGVDPSVVKITSDDPMAAARAAAILRLVSPLSFLSPQKR
ncbi:hypothetical protein EW026_g4659 [Hermanssonia centrifuga]|uniref:Uncharacterized protein n=1 Tax=Hermanssonia centrifuga TaxID=98765 RepID=A0A4V3XAA5_9APHY|nr:hypothetical protein EW026_g4659 [Hermanssonia centrifuga]